MYLPNLELHEPTTVPDAAALLERFGPAARLLAGGTDLLVDLKTGRTKAAHLVSINRITELHGVESVDGGIRIGALTTISELQESPLITRRFDALAEAASQMAAPQIRNMATVGGNVASAVPCADLPPVFFVMNAQAVLWSSSGKRTLPLDEFFLGPRQTARHDSELLTSIIVPSQPEGSGAAYARFALRDGNAIAVASVAASVCLSSDDTVLDARLALGAVAPTPKLVPNLASLLGGRMLDDSAIADAAEAAMRAADPLDDIRASAQYRCELVGVLTRRALIVARERAARGSR